jgi:hypothetical protein
VATQSSEANLSSNTDIGRGSSEQMRSLFPAICMPVKVVNS